MRGRVRVVCIGFDAHRAYPIRLGAARAQERFGVEVDVEVLDREEAGTLDPESAAQLARTADAVFVAALTEERFLPAARALAGSAPRFYPSAPNLFEISAMARVPGLALDDPGAAGALAAAAAACAAAGKPVPPVPGLVATVLPQAAHLVPEDQPELRRLGRVLQALLNLSPENAALAFAAVAHEAEPGQIPDPGWPEIYPACGFWHPDAGVFARWAEFEAALERRWRGRERVGRALVVVFSTQVTGGNDAHLRSLIAALERRGIEAVPWFGALDAAGEVGEVLKVPAIDLVINASGFTLTGTHGQPNIAGDVELLRRWDVPHLNAVPLLFQSLEQWEREPVGLLPMAVAMQVAVPELEAALAPRVFAGRAADDDRMAATAQADRVAAHAARLIQLRTRPNREKRVAIVLFACRRTPVPSGQRPTSMCSLRSMRSSRGCGRRATRSTCRPMPASC
ncbi:cobaltochelatase subunit CobN [Tepidiforma flava]|uniref:Cobaltochelatase subunit CobN n=1 Tax=Tepidiforma flava TaxID=3004094 RepID=A0ABY7M6I6_9CHLR|nr:cobaltochelatase subunit CobN [Tepidiforma flava]WBL36136.1 cobaltochelatase subunit CobN [Tepidiforma flava]